MQLEIDQLKQKAQDILSLARKEGVTQSEISISVGEGYDVSVRMNTPETVAYHRNRDIAITVYFGHHKGSIVTSHDDIKSLKKAVKTACHIAKFTEEDPCAGLAEENLMARHFPDLDLYHPWKIEAEEAIQLALRCENEALSLDKRIINSEGASVSCYQNLYLYGNSHGFIGTESGTENHISCVLVGEDQTGKQRDYDYSVARDPQDLKSIHEIAKKAVDRTISRLNPRQLSTRKAPVLFEASIARKLISAFIQAISGYRLYKQSSFLNDYLDKQVFPQKISIDERPHLLKGLGSMSFDSNGVATYNKNFVEKGILRNYVLDHYSACRLGMKTTGNAGGVHNVFMEKSDKNLSDLLKEMNTGLLVTELIGQGVNLVTGDYSKGVFGFWVEQGVIQYPVSEITIAGNLKDMFLNLVAVGNDIDTRSNIQTGSVLLEEMVIGGN